MFIKCPKCLENLKYDREEPHENGVLVHYKYKCNCGSRAEAFFPLNMEDEKWIRYYLISTVNQ